MSTIWSELKHFFATFDSLIVMKIRSDAYLCRSSHFDVNDNDRRKKKLLYPLLHMRARGNKKYIKIKITMLLTSKGDAPNLPHKWSLHCIK